MKNRILKRSFMKDGYLVLVARSGLCFVEFTRTYTCKIWDGTKFKWKSVKKKRMTLEKAKREKRNIIKCGVEGCSCPASVITSTYWDDAGIIRCMKHYKESMK